MNGGLESVMNAGGMEGVTTVATVEGRMTKEIPLKALELDRGMTNIQTLHHSSL